MATSLRLKAALLSVLLLAVVLLAVLTATGGGSLTVGTGLGTTFVVGLAHDLLRRRRLCRLS